GVILNINYHFTIEAFERLGIENFEELYSQAKQSSLFDLLEVGKISPSQFRNDIRHICQTNLSDNQIDEAWNAMLLDLPITILDLLHELKEDGFSLFLLSNTNQIHYEAYTQLLQRNLGITGLEELFDQSFFSHEIGRRKPNPETFLWVLKTINLKANEVIFIDDSIQHVEGAKEIGIKSFLHDGEIVEKIWDYLQ